MATQSVGDFVNASTQDWSEALGRINQLSHAVLQRNALLERRSLLLEQQVAELSAEIAMWQTAHSVAVDATERGNLAHQRDMDNLSLQVTQREPFKNQGPLIYCVVDGDEQIFQGFALGHEGGNQAAEHLTKAVCDFLLDNDVKGLEGLSFWIAVYYNRGELLARLVAHGICSPQQFDAFIAGFSKRSPNFLMIDTGYAEGTAFKITEHISACCRLPQTRRVFLAGGWALRYPHLWKRENVVGKLVTLGTTNEHSYSGVPGYPVHGLFTSFDGSHSRNNKSGLLSPQSPLSVAGSVPRRIDPTLPLHKQDPPPCNEHYLMKCSKAPNVCKYSHDYTLTPEQLASLAHNAKKAPCNWLKNGMKCPWGDQCCWGHACPNGSKCYHLSKGKCWFKGDSMHPSSPVLPLA